MNELLFELLAIPSPTFYEEKKVRFIVEWLKRYAIEGELTVHNNNIIYEIKIHYLQLD